MTKEQLKLDRLERAEKLLVEIWNPDTPAWKQRELRCELNSVFLESDTQAVGEQK